MKTLLLCMLLLAPLWGQSVAKGRPEGQPKQAHVRSFSDPANMAVTAGDLALARDALHAVNLILWTDHGIVGAEWASPKIHAMLSPRSSFTDGQYVLFTAVVNLWGAKFSNARFMAEQRKKVLEINPRSKLSSRVTTTQVYMDAEDREKACVSALDKILAAKVVPVKVWECEIAALDPRKDDLVSESFQKVDLAGPGDADSFSITARFREVIMPALDSIDLLTLYNFSIAGVGIAEERFEFAAVRQGSKGDKNLLMAANGRMLLRLKAIREQVGLSGPIAAKRQRESVNGLDVDDFEDVQRETEYYDSVRELIAKEKGCDDAIQRVLDLGFAAGAIRECVVPEDAPKVKAVPAQRRH